MKNKKFLTLVLALVMVLGTFSSVFAAAVTPAPATDTKVEEVKKVTGRDNKIQYLKDHGFVEGRKVNEDPKNNDLALDKNLKRSEITKLLVYAIGRQDLAAKVQGAMKVYSDVETTHWANGVITVGTTMASPANAVAMLNGYPGGTFKPERDVTYAELAKMLVVLVKKDLTPDMAKNAIWASSWLTWAAQLGILEDVTIADSNKAVTRADAFVMMYNALYAMKYVKRLPANETMGILSQLKNNELTLNQGDKAKTFKLTNQTTFVLYNQTNTLDVNANVKTAVKNVYAQAVKVSAINNPSYYYGSLVRVLTDDKGEVTHILELGNPRYLALGHDFREMWQHTAVTDNLIAPNRRWGDVADATVETSLLREYAENTVNGAFAVAAKINYDGGSAKSMDFVKGTFKAPINATTDGSSFYKEGDTNNFQPASEDAVTKVIANVRLTSKTRYYVADVAKNQLTEVKDIDDAIKVLGLTRASNWFLDVYAGYDEIGGRNAIEHSKNYAINGFNEATVIVFNSVQKGNNAGRLLRARTQSTNQYNISLENTKGEFVNENELPGRAGFPFLNARTEDGKNAEVANLDVVKYTTNNAYGRDAVIKIDHSNTTRYPIALVERVDGRTLILKGEFDETASVVLTTDYDKFLEADKLEGRYIQFHTLSNNKLENKVNENNVVDIVSVLPTTHTWAVKGSLRGVLEGNLANQHAGKIATIDLLESSVTGTAYQVIIQDYRSLYNTALNSATKTFAVNATEYPVLRAWLQTTGHTTEATRVDVRFKVRPVHNLALEEAYDFEVMVDGNWVLVRTITTGTGINGLVNAIEALPKAAADVKANNYVALRAKLTEIAGLVTNLPLADKNLYNSDAYKAHRDHVEAIEKAVKEYEAAKTALDLEVVKLDDTTLKDLPKADLTPAGVLTAVKAAVAGKVDGAKVKTDAVLTGAPETYVAQAPVKATATVTSVAKTDLVATVELLGNIAK